jgi:hypothetical protein
LDKKSANEIKRSRRGRPSGVNYTVRVTLPLTPEMVGAIAAATDWENGETRLEVIRSAIDQELKRRGRKRD